MNVWDALRDAISGLAGTRPEGSVTAREFAERTGCSRQHAAHLLAQNERLSGVAYKTDDGKRGKCYVLKVDK